MVPDHGNTPTFSRTVASPAVILAAAAVVMARVIALCAAPPVRAATGAASGTATATARKPGPVAQAAAVRAKKKPSADALPALGAQVTVGAAPRRAARRRACLRAAARARARRQRPAASPANPLHLELFGVVAGGGFHNEGPATLGRDLDAIQRLHAAWLRVDVNWAMIQAAGPGS